MLDYFGNKVSKLGFGLMRLPKKGLRTDIEQVKHMVDQLLTGHPEVNFVQLQINYAGWENPFDGKGKL